MKIPVAVKKAMAGGWEYRGVNASNFLKAEYGSMDDDVMILSKYGSYLVQFERIVLSVAFWNALGKAVGWDGNETYSHFLGMNEYLWRGSTIEQFFMTL